MFIRVFAWQAVISLQSVSRALLNMIEIDAVRFEALTRGLHIPFDTTPKITEFFMSHTTVIVLNNYNTSMN